MATLSQQPFLNLRRFKTQILCDKNKSDSAFREKKHVSVDYDKGTHQVFTQTSGFRKHDIPKHHRLRVETERFQKDWASPTKNFPVLIKEMTERGFCGALYASVPVDETLKNYCARTDIYNMLIRLHARHNLVDQARGLFFEMQEWRCKPDAESYNALINAHGRAGQWRWAMNIMDDMLRAAIPPSRSTYNNLINACGSRGNWSEALKFARK
ncbi:hypothetical protein M0R45_030491 [Rubus argutus]|uniref:Pentatricopeptide repeat-containing protein n=1 Tax=Rubus argutus TaxID=59490 RepID=A0AAW1WF83_RUBAR